MANESVAQSNKTIQTLTKKYIKLLANRVGEIFRYWFSVHIKKERHRFLL